MGAGQFWAESGYGLSSLMKNEAVELVAEIDHGHAPRKPSPVSASPGTARSSSTPESLTQSETPKLQPAETVPDQKLHLLVAQIMHQGQNQPFEHDNRVVRWATALGTIPVAKHRDQNSAKHLEINDAPKPQAGRSSQTTGQDDPSNRTSQACASQNPPTNSEADHTTKCTVLRNLQMSYHPIGGVRPTMPVRAGALPPLLMVLISRINCRENSPIRTRLHWTTPRRSAKAGLCLILKPGSKKNVSSAVCV